MTNLGTLSHNELVQTAIAVAKLDSRNPAEPARRGKQSWEQQVKRIDPHPKQLEFIQSTAKRRIIRAGRRGGKTVGASMIALEAFLAKRRVLYATPTADQIGRFWYEVTKALAEPVESKALYKNETEHVIEVPNTLQRIRAKTAWNADTLRGDFADLLILDEYQLMNEDAWEIVGAPMLLDNNGDAVFIYTPPSLRSAGTSKARDPRHAAKLFKHAQVDTSGRWQTFYFTSHDNPYISKEALADITQDMTQLAIEQEILAQDKEDNPAALFKRKDIEDYRVLKYPDLEEIAVGCDPSIAKGGKGDECGIVVCGRASGEERNGTTKHLYLLDDVSMHGSPDEWAKAVVTAYHKWHANYIIAEDNQGGAMVDLVIKQVDSQVRVELVHAMNSKEARADEIVPMYEQGRAHHIGSFPLLEDEMCQWQHGMPSPNRLDAHIHAAKKLMLTGGIQLW